jgi:hypothetical protein
VRKVLGCVGVVVALCLSAFAVSASAGYFDGNLLPCCQSGSVQDACCGPYTETDAYAYEDPIGAWSIGVNIYCAESGPTCDVEYGVPQGWSLTYNSSDGGDSYLDLNCNWAEVHQCGDETDAYVSDENDDYMYVDANVY